MSFNRKVISFFVFAAFYSSYGCAQSFSGTHYETSNERYDTLRSNQKWWLEVDLLMNPVYISQITSKYVLNHHKLNISPRPAFYAVQSGTSQFRGADPLSLKQDITEIEDQANAAYLNFPLKRLQRSRFGLLHDTRWIVGITHDKLQTSSSEVSYRYPNGGMELTLMLDKNLSQKLSDLDLKVVNLIFNIDVQAGFFVSVANIYPAISIPDTLIKAASDANYIWQEKNPYLGGWGWLASANFELGGTACKRYFISRGLTENTRVGKGLYHFFRGMGITIGAKIMAEGLYTSPKVLVNDVPSRLRVDNYGIFVMGPVISFKYIKF